MLRGVADRHERLRYCKNHETFADAAAFLNAGKDILAREVMLTMFHDLRFAARIFAKNPGATAVAVLSLALAIGPNCALFSVVDRLFLKPSPVQGITQIFSLVLRTDREGQWETPSYPDLLDYQAQAGDVGSFIAFIKAGAALNSSGQMKVVRMDLVTENYFSVLGARAAAGRPLRESDAHFEGAPPTVISYSLWQRQFGSASDAVGKILFLSGRAFSVVGIMPCEFRGPAFEVVPADVWIPFSAAPPGYRREIMQRGNLRLDSLVRLRDGVEKTRAEAVLTTVAKRLASQYPDTNKGKEVIFDNPGRGGMLSMIILSLAGLVVLIACANIAGILVAQGEARRREFAVRVAMGATRGRVVRQLVGESLLLSLAAAGGGLLLAFWLIRAMPALNPVTFLSVDFDFRLDDRVLGYTLLLTALTALAAGLVPALQASRPDLVATLKGEAPTGRRRFWFRGALVVMQIAFCQFLLVGAGLLFRSYLEIQQIRPGFDPERKVLAADLAAPAGGKTVDFARLADNLRVLPGVVRVSFTDGLLLSGSGETTKRLTIPGASTEPVEVGWRAAGGDYFAVMGTRLLRGRDFDRRDSTGVVVVNETMARQIWGSPDAAIGKLFRMDGTDCRVVGVAENGKYRWLQEEPMPFLFEAAPLGKQGGGTLLIETAAPPLALAGTIRKAIHDADPDAWLANLVTLRQHMRFSLFPYRIGAGLVATIAILGMSLAGVGLYGLVSYSVTRRTHEIGVRVAMGARPVDVLSLVLREALSRVAIGAVIGLALALAAARTITALFYQVSPADPLALAAAVAVVATVALLAAFAPARRALRVDPINALRHE
jgi:predicted permease